MRISAIVAISDNLAIGEKDMIPWYLPIDLKYFRDITIGHTVIMGRKTFDSIGKALPKRRNIVITSDPFLISSDLNHSRKKPRSSVNNLDSATNAPLIANSWIFTKLSSLLL